MTVDKEIAELEPGNLTPAVYSEIIEGRRVSISAQARNVMQDAADRLERALASGRTVYGVTTGYGANSDQKIPPSARSAFQVSTLRSHACGTGFLLERRVARGVWLCKAASLSTGLTGASTKVVEALCELLNLNLAPAIPVTGSLGASGDLVPSAHAALPLIGEGELLDEKGNAVPSSSLLSETGFTPLELGSRDGLSLVNGTATTLALSLDACAKVEALLGMADGLVAAGLEASGGHSAAFSSQVAGARPHPGSAASATAIRSGLEDVPPEAFGSQGVHDPYSWRCVPQVHGAACDALSYAKDACARELAGCSDNPLVLEDSGRSTLVSGGNFIATPLGLPMDNLTRAVGHVASLSRQRLSRLLEGKGGTPQGLVPDSTPSVGLTMLLATSTALVLEIRGSAPATNNWLPFDEAEDFVSNDTLAARQAIETVDRGWKVLATEGIAIAAVADIRDWEPRGRSLRHIHGVVRSYIDPPGLDRQLDRALTMVTQDLRKRSSE